MLQRYFLVLFFLVTLPFSLRAQTIEFVRNDGQWDGPFRYKAVTGRGDAYLGSNAFTYVLGDRSNDVLRDEAKHGRRKTTTLRYHAYEVSFEGAAPSPVIQAGKEQSWYYNYFLGSDSRRWHSGIHPALALDYKELYPGVDMHVASQNGHLKYEFIIAPGVDPAIVRLKYDGVDGLSVKGRNLVIGTSVGEVQELRPVAYQYGAEGRQEVRCNYRVSGNVVTYHLPDGYDASLPLIIDPIVVFATFTGATSDNWGFTATYDKAGNFYGGGTVASTGFPVSTGAFQNTYQGGTTGGIPGDMAVIKYNSAGSSMLWASYLGGSAMDQPHSMVVDTGNALVVAGRTFSSNYPTVSGAYDGTYNGNADIVVTKFNSTGTALLGSTFVGGSGDEGANIFSDELRFGSLKYNYGDDARSEVILDAGGNVYVAAASSSTDFPCTSTAYQASRGGKQDAVFFKMSPNLTSMIYSTYLGGSEDDAGYVLALNRQQSCVYIGGGTASSNFPSTTGTWKTTYQGGPADGYIARFNNSGTYGLQRVSFIGTGNYDQVYGVQVDLENSVYAMGQSLGGAFPVTSGVYSNAGSCQFIMKLDSLLATNVFSTVYGSTDKNHTDISPVAFLVDTCQNIYISGWGGNLELDSIPATVGTTTGMPVTPASIPTGSVLKSTTDGYDFYFMALSRNAGSLLFGAFYGRTSSIAGYGEHVDGGTSRFDRQGIVYQAICGGCGGSSSPSLPTTSGSFSTTNRSPNCNLASLKIAFQLGAPAALAGASPRTRGCPPLTVQFANTSTNAISYLWNFRDGSPTDTSFQPKHTFTTPGIYNVQLVVYNPNACKIRDTTIVTIVVDSNRIESEFNFKVTDTCGPYRALFTNVSRYSSLPGSVARTTFTWYFGDGTTSTAVNPGSHSFPSAGLYTVQLVMHDPDACNDPDTVIHFVLIGGSNVKAQFTSPDSVCQKAGLTFTNASTNATGIIWNFGDGQTSTSATPVVHTFAGPGTYIVTLVALNPNTCNKTDTIRKTIRIKKLPTADFLHAPVIPESNKPVQFTNKSTNADRYTWNFGDGSPRNSETNPSHLFRKTGTFTVCLKATSNEGCADSVCKSVEADIHTALDIPTGFSPNGDGNNDILYVRGGGIETMSLRIFNRWGEKVFESSSMASGWDGTFKGKPQEIDAYGYVLTATFIDGSSATKKGNITLVR